MENSRREFIEYMLAFGAIASNGCMSCKGGKRWYKGNLHTHSLWSDGMAFPEQAVEWYRDHGYNFLCLSDHNVDNDRTDGWARVTEDKEWSFSKCPFWLQKRYFKDYGEKPTRKNAKGETEVRLARYSELEDRYNSWGEFLMVPGFEMTHAVKDSEKTQWDVHMNMVGVKGVPEWYNKWKFVIRDETVDSLIEKKENEAFEYSEQHGGEHIFILNHPVWRWYDVGPESLIRNWRVRFFEVCNNGAIHPAASKLPNDGFDTDRFWDVVNAFRARRGQPLLYGIGTDDTHNYFSESKITDNYTGRPGNAWTMVKADCLCWHSLREAMLNGDMVACNGIELADVEFDKASKVLKVVTQKPIMGAVSVKFIVTKKDFSEKILDTVEVVNGKQKRKVNIYDMSKIGVVAKTVNGECGKAVTAEYQLKSDDLYVRARVQGWRVPICRAELCPKYETAWTQPYR